MNKASNINLNCDILGLGAWGPGFCNWQQLADILLSTQDQELSFSKPAPQIIPANERRRAPLVVKMAVETSSQAIAQSGLKAKDVSCVFGSGLGDTAITDYLCRALLPEEKQLSPTKFHNSVHNTAAGYWTISTGCMEAANSIAAYQYTSGMILFEGLCECREQQAPVLLTFYDTEVCELFSDLFNCNSNIALSILIAPSGYSSQTLTKLEVKLEQQPAENRALLNPALEQARQHNPAADILLLLEKIASLQHRVGNSSAASFPVSSSTSLFAEVVKS